MKPFSVRLKKWLAFAAGAMVTVFAVYWACVLWVLPAFIQTSTIQSQIESQLYKTTGLVVHIDSMRIKPTLFFGLDAQFNGVSVSDSLKHPLGKANRVHVYLKLLPLLSQKLEIHRLLLESPDIWASPNSAWFKIKLAHNPKSPIVFNNVAVEARHYIIHSQLSSNRPLLELSGDSLKLKHLLADDKPLTITLRGKLEEPHSAHVLLRLLQSDVTFSPKTVSHFPTFLLGLEGTVEAKDIDIKRLNRFFPKPLPWLRSAEPVSTLNLGWYGGSAHKQVNLVLKTQTGELRTSGNVGITDPFGKSTLQLRVQAKHVPLQWLSQLSTRPVGDVSGSISSDLTLGGTLEKPQTIGSLSLQSIHWTPPHADKPLIANLSGKLDFRQKGLFPSLQGRISGSAVHLSSNTLKRQYTLDIEQLDLTRFSNSLPSVAAFLPTQLNAFLKRLSLSGQLSTHVTGSIDALTDWQGTCTWQNGAVKDRQNPIGVDGLNARLTLLSGRIRVDELKGQWRKTLFSLTGESDLAFKHYLGQLKTSTLDLAQLQTDILTLFPKLSETVAPYGLEKGTGTFDLAFQSGKPLQGLTHFEQLAFHPPAFNQSIEIVRLDYDSVTGRLNVPKRGVRIGDILFALEGTLKPGAYDIRIQSERVTLASIADQLAKLKAVFGDLPLPTVFNTQGTVEVAGHFQPKHHDITLSFVDAGASFKELKYPIYNINGRIHVVLAPERSVESDSLSFRYANSPMQFKIKKQGKRYLALSASGTISPLFMNDLLLNRESSLITYASMPFEIQINGRPGELLHQGKGTDLTGIIHLNAQSVLNSTYPVVLPTTEGSASDKSLAQVSALVKLKEDTFSFPETLFNINDQSAVSLSGVITHLFDPDKRDTRFILDTKPTLDLAALVKQLNPNAKDRVSGQITATPLEVHATGGQVDYHGVITFRDIVSDWLQLAGLNGAIHFEGPRALIQVSQILLPGIDVGFNTQIDDLHHYPLAFSAFDLKGQQFIVPLFTQWLDDVIRGRVKNTFWTPFFPHEQARGLLPFSIESGTLQVAEGVLNNLIVEDFGSDIRMYPNTYFELPNAHAKSAGGKAKGYFAMNPNSNHFMTLHLEVDKMKANALSKILLNVSNQIFGDLSGVIDFTTEGNTPQEFLANTNGYSKLTIANGRLPDIAKMENLLVAANTISGGIANLNLNSLFRIAAPFKTDYFATLRGSFKMVDGVIYGDDWFSDGQNLDLSMQGKIRMMDGSADMIVTGRMDRDIGGRLGPLGQFSVGRVLSVIPGLRAIIGNIPGLGFVPGFGGPKGEKGVAFKVHILGPMVDPGSVQDFKWIR